MSFIHSHKTKYNLNNSISTSTKVTSSSMTHQPGRSRRQTSGSLKQYRTSIVINPNLMAMQGSSDSEAESPTIKIARRKKKRNIKRRRVNYTQNQLYNSHLKFFKYIE